MYTSVSNLEPWRSSWLGYVAMLTYALMKELIAYDA